MAPDRLCALLVLAACMLACTRTEAPRRTQIQMPAGADVEVADIVVAPAKAVRGLYLDAARRTLTVISDQVDLTVRIRGLCPLSLPQKAATVEARRLFELPEVLAQVGFDAPVDVRVVPGCAQAAAGRIEWRQREGLPLAALASSERGFRLTARTLPLARYLDRPLPAGVVPVSPRTQGRYVLEAIGRVEGHAPVRRILTITSIARATGMASLAVSQRVMLGGAPLAVARRPRGATAEVVERDGVQTFQPDVAGRYLLAGADGRKLELTALTHEHTPMDCARSECHAALSARAAQSPMSFAFARAEAPGAHGEALPGCAFECHAVGERGLDDGGFLALARAFPFEPDAVERMPHALQRLTSVRCTSCHGPSALPDAQGRERILRADVCATCHDAPPAYVHVARWRGSRLAVADVDPQTRADPRCARCHTTAGFLAALGVRKAAPPEEAIGLACAACHAPHGASIARLLRDVPVPESLGDPQGIAHTSSALCSACHAPQASEPVPAASAAALWLGRVRLPPELGAPAELRGAAPHRDVPNGCVGCHGQTAQGKMDHGLKADAGRCARCHATPPAPGDAALGERAGALVAALRRACAKPDATTPASLHARADAAACGSTGARARALYLAMLVAGDRGASAHNAPFARVLLEQAEAAAAAASTVRVRGGR